MLLLVAVKPWGFGPVPCNCQWSPLAKQKVSQRKWTDLMARLNKKLLPGSFSSINFVLYVVLYNILYGTFPFLQYFPPF